MILLGKLGKVHILLGSCYKWTKHSVYFPLGTISFKTGENVVPAHASRLSRPYLNSVRVCTS